MMKLSHFLLLISVIAVLATSLRLTSEQDHKEASQLQNHKYSYYGRNYRSHRSDEYVDKVKEENRKKIEAFNNRNKNKLKSVGGGGQTVTGGNSFVMGETKFLEFTEEEFIKLFTGLKRAAAHHEHNTKESHEQSSPQQTHQSQQSKSHRIFNSHFLNKVSANQIQQHFQQTTQENHNQESHDQSWTFYDPFSIDDSYIDSLYGNVNSNNNYGWDWNSWDSNYYNTPTTKKNYWDSWENEHWGYSKNDKGWDWGSGSTASSLWDSDWGWSNTNSDSWWNGWSTAETTNANNNNWWTLDYWTQPSKPTPTPTPSKPNNPTPSKPTNSTPSKPNPTPAPKPNTTSVIQPYAKTAIEVNWVIKGATTHVKQQGECGSCWTYSAVAVIQSYFLIKGLGKMDLSEQQLVDCQKKYCYGCDGGQENLGLEWGVNNGLVAEDKYPYRGVNQKCAHSSGPHKIPKYVRYSGRTQIEDGLRKGPITAAVYVNDGFQFYKKGIFDKCVKSTPNHAVVLVGFTKDYWIIRNSWGADWGEDGHIRLKKDQNKGNACSIQDDAYGVSQ